MLGNNSVLNVTCTGEGKEVGEGEKHSSKTQLFVFALFTCSLTTDHDKFDHDLTF